MAPNRVNRKFGHFKKGDNNYCKLSVISFNNSFPKNLIQICVYYFNKILCNLLTTLCYIFIAYDSFFQFQLHKLGYRVLPQIVDSIYFFFSVPLTSERNIFLKKIVEIFFSILGSSIVSI